MNSNLAKNFIAFIQSYLVAIIPLVFLWLHNWTDTFFYEVLFIGSILLALTVLFFLLTKLIIDSKDTFRQEAFISTALFFTLYFGYVCSYESSWFKFLYTKGLISLKILIPLWCILGLLATKKVMSCQEKTIIAIIQLKRRFIYIILALLLGNFFLLFLQHSEQQENLTINPFKHKPNIYYIILNAYPRQDTLKELYGYDNEPFLQELEQLGFTICRKNCSNYPVTRESIPSTLAMNYLPYDKITLTGQFYSISDLFKNNQVFSIVKKNGYTLINISGGTYFTSHYSEAINVSSSLIHTTYFSLVFIDKTIAGPFWAKMYKGNPCGKNIINQLDCAEKAFDYPSPKFVFLHVLSPHPPFYLTREGLLRNTNDPDLFSFKGHLESVEGISKRILTFIKKIREKDDNSIIILQSDHGSDVIHGEKYQSSGPLPAGILKERMGNLNAFYFPPNIKPTTIPQTLTNVNTFRFVFSILSEPIPFLEEKIFFCHYGQTSNNWVNQKIYMFTPEEINDSPFIK